MEVTTMSGVTVEVGTVVSAAFAWAGDVVTFITSNPLVLLFVSIPLVGLGIGLVTRLIRG